jgi:acetyltransferase-like isoleucine patch superfamily enzyme
LAHRAIARARADPVRPRTRALRVRLLLAPRLALDRLMSRYLARLGFVNYRRAAVWGPADRLHLARPIGVNALFNTRSGHIHVGADTVISHDTLFLTGRHVARAEALGVAPRDRVPDAGYDIHIGRGCWIAAGAMVTGGVTIGDRSVVAAGAVVTRDVPPDCLVAGVPARVIGPAPA